MCKKFVTHPSHQSVSPIGYKSVSMIDDGRERASVVDFHYCKVVYC